MTYDYDFRQIAGPREYKLYTDKFTTLAFPLAFTISFESTHLIIKKGEKEMISEEQTAVKKTLKEARHLYHIKSLQVRVCSISI